MTVHSATPGFCFVKLLLILDAKLSSRHCLLCTKKWYTYLEHPIHFNMIQNRTLSYFSVFGSLLDAKQDHFLWEIKSCKREFPNRRGGGVHSIHTLLQISTYSKLCNFVWANSFYDNDVTVTPADFCSHKANLLRLSTKLDRWRNVVLYSWDLFSRWLFLIFSLSVSKSNILCH